MGERMHGNELRRRGFGFLFEMGCGKTLTAIAVAGTAYQMGKIRKVLIVAPTSVCSVWPKEFEEYADFRYNVQVLLGDKQKEARSASEPRRLPLPGASGCGYQL